MAVDILLGLQWGDEGKGKIVDYLAEHYDVVARFQGGPNAGHTLKVNGESFVLHTIPSGVFHEGVMNVIGNGVVIDPVVFQNEIRKLNKLGIDIKNKLLISNKAQLILPTHKLLDAASEARKGESKIGSTLRGIGPTYMDKTGRNGLRIGDIKLPNFKDRYDFLKEKHFNLLKLYEFENDVAKLEEKWFEGIELIKTLQLDNAEYYLSKALETGKSVLAEGAQGTMLDIDFGTYPYVTSSNTISAAACNGLGIPPTKIKEVYGITKAYCTRVGGGPFPTELENETGELLRKEGAEFGATTGRPRRCGWIDLPALKYSCLLNGVTQLIITKADVLNIFDEVKLCVAYKINGQETDELPFDLSNVKTEPVYETLTGWNQAIGNIQHFEDMPSPFIEFVEFVENYLGVEVTIISNGPKREELVLKKLPAAV